jgi:hypothetical protein
VIDIFKIGSLELFLWAGFEPLILLISAFWVARITRVSLQHPAVVYLLCICSFVYLLLLFSGTGVWTQGFAFAKQVPYPLTHTSRHCLNLTNHPTATSNSPDRTTTGPPQHCHTVVKAKNLEVIQTLSFSTFLLPKGHQSREC